MVTAIILMNVKRSKVNEVAGQLADMPEISEAYSVSGSHDLIAIVRVKSNDELADLVTGPLSRMDDIEKTETIV